jgi:AbrB family looped-hinge helix DNA binding protein
LTLIINRDGRILLPKQIRNALHITEGSRLEIKSYTETELVLGKVDSLKCVYCGKTENLYKELDTGKNICVACLPLE